MSRIYPFVITISVVLVLVFSIIVISTSIIPIQKPNFVVIMADDLDVNSFNVLLTNGFLPNIQENIIRHGTLFTNSFVTISNCCPSRVTFLTGLYSHNHEVYTNDPETGGSIVAFNDSSSLAVWLHNANYRTGLVGKYLNGYGTSTSIEYIPPGWVDWQALIDPFTYRMYNYRINDNGKIVEYSNLNSEYQTDVLAQRASDFIYESKALDNSIPFFLAVNTVSPHVEIPSEKQCNFNEYVRLWSIRAPERYLNTTYTIPFLQSESFNENDIVDKPFWIQQRPLLNEMNKDCIKDVFHDRLGSIRAIDDLVGKVIDSLKNTEELTNTIIVFTSDNGFLMGEHRHFGKGVAYEESIRVPLIIRTPFSESPQYSSHLVLNNDFAPTISEFAGATPDIEMDGQSLIPLLDKTNPDKWRKKFLIEFWNQSGIPTYSAIRTTDYLYVKYEDNFEEIYDLDKDPNQMDNRFFCTSTECTEQKHLLQKWLSDLKICGKGTCQILEAED